MMQRADFELCILAGDDAVSDNILRTLKHFRREEDAIRELKMRVREELRWALKTYPPVRSEAELFERYSIITDGAFIPGSTFSATAYARRICRRLALKYGFECSQDAPGPVTTGLMAPSAPTAAPVPDEPGPRHRLAGVIATLAVACMVAAALAHWPDPFQLFD